MHETFDPVGDVGPINELVGARDDAGERDAPGLGGRLGEAQALERQGDAGDEAEIGDAAFGIPHGVEAEVVTLAFGVEAVELHAERIGGEDEAALLVVEGIEEDLDAFVARDVLAFGEPGADLGGVVVADEDGVDVLVVVGEEDLGLEAGRVAVAGHVLAEAGDHHAAFGQGGAGEVLELGRRGHPLEAQRRGLRRRFLGCRRGPAPAARRPRRASASRK